MSKSTKTASKKASKKSKKEVKYTVAKNPILGEDMRELGYKSHSPK